MKPITGRMAIAAKGDYNKKYVRTAFCITAKEGDFYLLCHTATGELLKLTEEEYQQYEKNIFTDEKLRRGLIDRLYLVKEGTDEFIEVDRERTRYHQKRLQKDCAIKSFTILPTTRCNARCFYCYENGIRQKNMTAETVKRTIEYITEKSRGEEVHLSWFGGEPTVARQTIRSICDGLKTNGIKFKSSMITNGLLFDDRLLQEAYDFWKLTHMQITIDGTEEVYASTKNYKGFVKDPFHTVLSNIENALSKGIYVDIRINLGIHNYEDVEKLIEILEHRFHQSKQLNIYVHEIDHCYMEDENRQLKRKAQMLNFSLCAASFRSVEPLPSIRLHYCMADSPSSLLINPEGGIGKCEHYLFDKLVGSIFVEGFDEEMLAQWQQKVDCDNCHHCPLYPSCATIKWCNGANNNCTDEILKSKKEQVRYSMRIVYRQWESKMDAFRNRDCFYLRYPVKTELDNTTVSYQDLNGQEIQITLNNEAIDILHYLETPHTFHEISKMIYFDYDISKERADEDTESCMLRLLEYGIIAINNGKSICLENGIAELYEEEEK